MYLWLPNWIAGRGRRKINYKFGTEKYILLYIKQINKYQLYSIGNYSQYLIITHKGKECEKQYTHTHTHTYVYIYMNHFAACQKLTHHCRLTIS